MTNNFYMIKSKRFWIGLILFSVIPLLLIDIAEHSVNWKKEVREEIISVVHNQYAFDKAQKAAILDRVFERNQVLTFLIYAKSLASVVLLIFSFHFFSRYKKENASTLTRSLVTGLVVVTCFILAKVFL